MAQRASTSLNQNLAAIGALSEEDMNDIFATDDAEKYHVQHDAAQPQAQVIPQSDDNFINDLFGEDEGQDIDDIPDEEKRQIDAIIKSSNNKGFGALRESFKTGLKSFGIESEVGDTLFKSTLLSPEEKLQKLEQLRKINDYLNKQVEADGKKDVPKILEATAGVLGGIWGGISGAWKEALAGAAIGAGIGATIGAGAAIPTTAGLAAPATGAAGAATGAVIGAGRGFAVGSFRQWASQGAGQSYLALTESGINDDIATKVSIPAGIVYGAVEHITRLIPGQPAVMKLFKNYLQREVSKSAVRVGARLVTNVAGEAVLEEPTQQVVMDIANNIAADMMNQTKGTAIEKFTSDEIFKRALDSGIQAIGPAALIGGAGSSIELHGAKQFSEQIKALEEQAGLSSDDAKKMFDSAKPKKDEQQGDAYVRSLKEKILADSEAQTKIDIANEENIAKAAKQRDIDIQEASDLVKGEVLKPDADLNALAEKLAKASQTSVDDLFPDGVSKESISDMVGVDEDAVKTSEQVAGQKVGAEYKKRLDDMVAKLGDKPSKKAIRNVQQAVKEEFKGKIPVSVEGRKAFNDTIKPTPLTPEQVVEAEKLKARNQSSRRAQSSSVKNASEQTLYGISESANDLITSVEDGGVPMIWTSNLKKIADENGFTVTDKSTPNELVAFLQEKKVAAVKDSAAKKEVSIKIKFSDVDATEDIVTRGKPVIAVKGDSARKYFVGPKNRLYAVNGEIVDGKFVEKDSPYVANPTSLGKGYEPIGSNTASAGNIPKEPGQKFSINNIGYTLVNSAKKVSGSDKRVVQATRDSDGETVFIPYGSFRNQNLQYATGKKKGIDAALSLDAPVNDGGDNLQTVIDGEADSTQIETSKILNKAESQLEQLIKLESEAKAAGIDTSYISTQINEQKAIVDEAKAIQAEISKPKNVITEAPAPAKPIDVKRPRSKAPLSIDSQKAMQVEALQPGAKITNTKTGEIWDIIGFADQNGNIFKIKSGDKEAQLNKSRIGGKNIFVPGEIAVDNKQEVTVPKSLSNEERAALDIQKNDKQYWQTMQDEAMLVISSKTSTDQEKADAIAEAKKAQQMIASMNQSSDQSKTSEIGDIDVGEVRASSRKGKTVDLVSLAKTSAAITRTAKLVNGKVSGSFLSGGTLKIELPGGMRLEFVQAHMSKDIGQNERIRDTDGRVVGWRIRLDPRDATPITVWHEGHAGHAAWDMLTPVEKAEVAAYLKREGIFSKYEAHGRKEGWWSDKWNGIQAADEVAARYISENMDTINKFSKQQTKLGKIWSKIKQLLETITGGTLFAGARNEAQAESGRQKISDIASGRVLKRDVKSINNIFINDDIRKVSESSIFAALSKANPSFNNARLQSYSAAIRRQLESPIESTRENGIRLLRKYGANELADQYTEEVRAMSASLEEIGAKDINKLKGIRVVNRKWAAENVNQSLASKFQSITPGSSIGKVAPSGVIINAYDDVGDLMAVVRWDKEYLDSLSPVTRGLRESNRGVLLRSLVPEASISTDASTDIRRSARGTDLTVYRGSVQEAGGANVGATIGSGIYVTSNLSDTSKLAAIDYAGGKFSQNKKGFITEYKLSLDKANILDTNKKYDLYSLISDNRLSDWFRKRLSKWVDNGWYKLGLKGSQIVQLVQAPPPGHGSKADMGKAGFDAIVTYAEDGTIYEASITNEKIINEIRKIRTQEGRILQDSDIRSSARSSDRSNQMEPTLKEFKARLMAENGTKWRESDEWKKFVRSVAKSGKAAELHYPDFAKKMDFDAGINIAPEADVKRHIKAIEKDNPKDVEEDITKSGLIGKATNEYRHNFKSFLRRLTHNLPLTATMISRELGKEVRKRLLDSGNGYAAIKNRAFQSLKDNKFDKMVAAMRPDEAVSIRLPNGKMNVKIPRGMLLSYIRLTQNPSGRRAIMAGGNFGVAKNGPKMVKFDTSSESLITAADKELEAWGRKMLASDKSLADMHNLITKIMDNDVFPELARVYKSITGKDLKKENAYIAIQRIGDLDTELEQRGMFARLLTDWKALDSRTTSNRPILITDATSSMYNSLENASRFIGYAENMRYLRGLLGSSLEDTSGEVSGTLADTIDAKLGAGTAKFFLEQLQSTEGAYDKSDWKFVRRLIQRQDVARLMGPSTMLTQFGAIFMPMLSMDIGTVLRGFAHPYDKELIEKVKLSDRGNILRLRLDQSQAADEFAEARHNRSRAERIVEKWAFTPMRWADSKTVEYYIKMAREHVNDSRPDLVTGSKEYYNAIADKATEMVNDFQPTGLMEYRTAMHNSGLFGQMINRYRTSVNAINATIMRKYIDAKRDNTTASRAALFSSLAAPILAQAAFFAMADVMLDVWRDGIKDATDDDDSKRKRERDRKLTHDGDSIKMAFMANKAMNNFIQQAPMGSQIAYGIAPVIEYLTTRRQDKMSGFSNLNTGTDPMSDFFVGTRELGAAMIKMAEIENSGDRSREANAKFAKAARDAIDASVKVTQYMPIGNILPQVNRWLGLSGFVEKEMRE